MKIYLGDLEGNYNLKKTDYGCPYIESEEIIQSFIEDSRHTDMLDLCKQIFDKCKKYEECISPEDFAYFTQIVLDYWIKNYNEDELVNLISKSLNKTLDNTYF